jgi:DNA polymerase-4
MRRIAHIDLDSFFVSVERLLNPELVGKPVIVGSLSPRGVVSSASYEARAFGVRSAMPSSMAARLCPQGIFVYSGAQHYRRYSLMVEEIISAAVPRVQKASIDEFYLDLTGMDRFYPVFDYLLSLKSTIQTKTGLPLSFALATNKLISKIATNEAKPNGQIEIPPGTEKEFLSPMAIGKLPGCGEKTIQILMAAGIQTIGQIATAGPQMLERLLGNNGIDLYHKAIGVDDSAVLEHQERKSISCEETFSTDVLDPLVIEKELTRLCEKAGFELRKGGRLAASLAIKLRYENFETITRQQTLEPTGADHVFIKTAKDLFRKHYAVKRKLRLVGVRLGHFQPSDVQLDLFGGQQGEKKLYKAIDEIKQQFGRQAIFRAASANPSAPPGESTDGTPLWLPR